MTSGALDFGVLAFTSLFAVINPVSAAPVFVGLTRDKSLRERRRVALRAALTAAIVLAVFAAAGGAILAFVGITVHAFRIAGGLLFTLMALRELLGMRDVDADAGPSDSDPSIVPIGIPLIAGAGAISTVMVLTGQATAGPYQFALVLAILGNVVATFVVLALSPHIVSRLGPQGQQVVSRLMGLLNAVIGVQFILNGVSGAVLEILQQK